MLSSDAVAYALVDLFEFDLVQLSGAEEAIQVMDSAGTPCELVHEGGLWSVRLKDRAGAFGETGIVRSGPPRGLEGAA